MHSTIKPNPVLIPFFIFFSLKSVNERIRRSFGQKLGLGIKFPKNLDLFRARPKKNFFLKTPILIIFLHFQMQLLIRICHKKIQLDPTKFWEKITIFVEKKNFRGIGRIN